MDDCDYFTDSVDSWSGYIHNIRRPGPYSDRYCGYSGNSTISKRQTGKMIPEGTYIEPTIKWRKLYE